MELSPIFSEFNSKRTLSQGTQAWRDASIHPLFSTQGLVRVRSHLSIADWLLAGSCLQSLLVLVKPARIPLGWALAPTFGLAAFKITRLALTCLGWLENVHMRDVIPGRQMAVFPEPLDTEGRMVREMGRTVGGEKVVVVLITSKYNQCVDSSSLLTPIPSYVLSSPCPPRLIFEQPRRHVPPHSS